MHWIVRVARAKGLPGADSLQVSPRAPAEEAWATTTAHCGISEDALADAIAAWFRLDVARFEDAEALATNLLPGPVAREFNVYPLEEDERYLVVAIADPCDVAAEQQVGFASGRIPQLRVAPPGVISQRIDSTYAPDRAVANLLDRIEPGEDVEVMVVEDEDEPELDPQMFEDEDEEGTGPIVRLTNMILEDAVTKGASDIHLQPLPTGGVIRLRIDGVLRSGITVPLVVLARVISRIKIMSRLDISDKMRPQDGRARVRIAGHKYDLRISTVPVRGGEKAVIRILDPTGSGNLEECGLPEREVKRLRRVLKNRDGILVVTGPTGSGKTTTMYGALKEISTEDVNIMTVEDPVEYELVGLTQIQVDAKKGVSFHSALKAILRQDPDVIFVGEIRDSPTAEMAAQASLTGHLVLATVHANDAVGSIRRFLDLGLESGTISETLRGALAQRLLRTFCEVCVQPAEGMLDDEERELAERYGVEPVSRAVGCEACGQSGYRGRRPVVELLVPSQDLLQLVSEGASHVELTARAREDGMRTLAEGALDLVAQGLTSLAEMERVTGEDAAPPPPKPVAPVEPAPAVAPAPAAEEPPAEPAPVEVAQPQPPAAAEPEASTPPPATPEATPPAAPPTATPEATPPVAPTTVPPAPPATPPGKRRVPPPAPPAVPPHLETPPEPAPAPPPEPAPPPPPAPEPAPPTPTPTPEPPPAPEPALTPSTAEVVTGVVEEPWGFEDDEEHEAPRVLIVDDDESSRLLVRTVLENQGWQVEEARDGKDALLAIGMGEGLSLIILDLGLPDIDGLDILRAAKRNLATAGIPVIGLTGRTDRESERQLLMEGADDYIRKPLDPPIFLMRAKAVVRRVGTV